MFWIRQNDSYSLDPDPSHCPCPVSRIREVVISRKWIENKFTKLQSLFRIRIHYNIFGSGSSRKNTKIPYEIVELLTYNDTVYKGNENISWYRYYFFDKNHCFSSDVLDPNLYFFCCQCDRYIKNYRYSYIIGTKSPEITWNLFSFNRKWNV